MIGEAVVEALAADGDYVIEARALTSEEVGRYRLRVEETPPPPAPVEAGFGRTVEGEIADADAQADNGARYQSKLFNLDFLREKGLPTPRWLEEKRDIEIPYEQV